MANKFYQWQKFRSRFGLWKRIFFRSKKEKINKLIENQGERRVQFSEESLQLLETLGQENLRVKEFIINNYKGLPVSPEMEEETYNYCVTHSAIFAVTTSNPGTSTLTEFLYEGIPFPSPIDNYFLQSKGGKAVKARLIAIEKELPKIIEEYRSKGNVLIGNLGSGPGRDVIDTLSNYYRNISDVRAIHIDRDKKALERGKRMAEIKGVNHLIEFVQENFLRYTPPQKFDILLLIGVLCPLEIQTCIEYLKTTKRLLKEGGCIVASNVSKKMLREDPFTYYLMKWGANWELVYKNEEELKQIYEKSGYRWERCFSDSYGFHIMGIGRPYF